MIKSRRPSRQLLALGATVLLLMLGVSGLQSAARAESDSKRDSAALQVLALLEASAIPQETLENLSPEDYKLALFSLEQATVSVRTEFETVQGDQLLSSCFGITHYREGFGGVGTLLWRWTQYVSWCFDGTVITSINAANDWGTTHAPLWEYAGYESAWEAGEVGLTYFTRFGQGHFRLACTPWVGCIQHVYPWIQHTSYGDGSYNKTAGG